MPDGAATEQPLLASKKVSEYNSETGRGRGDRECRDLIFDSVEMNLLRCQSHTEINVFSKAENPEKSAQTQMVIEIERQILNPMHESALG